MITVGIATLPSRGHVLFDTIESIYDQVDKIIIGLNGHKTIPKILQRDKIECHFLNNEKGDAAKFFKVPEEGFFFSMDDDLIYPKDYVKTTIKALKDHSVVSYHGRNFDYPIASYYKSAKERYYCLEEVKKKVKVQVCGTGVTAFDCSKVKITYDKFLLPNMADIWFSLECKKQGHDIYVLPHKKGWIEYNKKMNNDTIYEHMKDKDQAQTLIMNECFK